MNALGAVPEDDVRWALASQPLGLQWRRWDDEVVVRVQTTGDTHLLTPAAACVFTVLLEAPASMSASQLADTLLEQPDAAEVHVLHRLLGELERFGVLVRVIR